MLYIIFGNEVLEIEYVLFLFENGMWFILNNCGVLKYYIYILGLFSIRIVLNL